MIIYTSFNNHLKLIKPLHLTLVTNDIYAYSAHEGDTVSVVWWSFSYNLDLLHQWEYRKAKRRVKHIPFHSSDPKCYNNIKWIQYPVQHKLKYRSQTDGQDVTSITLSPFLDNALKYKEKSTQMLTVAPMSKVFNSFHNEIQICLCPRKNLHFPNLLFTHKMMPNFMHADMNGRKQKNIKHWINLEVFNSSFENDMGRGGGLVKCLYQVRDYINSFHVFIWFY